MENITENINTTCNFSLGEQAKLLCTVVESKCAQNSF